ncbi:hypothetical protein [Nocardia sp. alder85J]|uniref:hypothetical protein n=1 Tax=Nocardia sp. alder85J TaxID=2862949 RepID=UPI001CD31947|nr:hypothetical protein [Nocardia sp. alder85J]MCX4094530.1 hypothetical protein [Nocardia sp. alder85J]
MIHPDLLDERIQRILTPLSMYHGADITVEDRYRINDAYDMDTILHILHDAGLVSTDIHFHDASDDNGPYGYFSRDVPTPRGDVTVTFSGVDYDREFNGPRDDQGYTTNAPLRTVLDSILRWLHDQDQQADTRLTALRDSPRMQPGAPSAEPSDRVSVVSLGELVAAARAGVELFGTAGDQLDVLSSSQIDALQRVAEAYATEDDHGPQVAIRI